MAAEAVDFSALSEAEQIRAFWSVGELSWLLRPHQVECYELYRQWERRDPTLERGDFARVFVLDISRRWGKTTVRVLTRMEDCIRNPGHVYRYVTAFQKDIEEIIDDVSRVLLETCPSDLRPKYKMSAQAQAAGFYFPNGSILKLAGLDKNPDALRGRASDGDDISEAAFVSQLRYSIKNVLYPQYQGRPWARLCLESTAPDGPDTEYDNLFVADAKERGAYYFATIEDNTSLSAEERDEFIRAAGGIDDPDCRREYFCERVVDPTRALTPEFSRTKHVRRVDMPEWFTAYTVMDPGMTDLLALVFCYWHHELDKLIVMRSWAEFNAPTHKVADVIRERERELWWGKNGWYDTSTRKVLPQPFARISDTDQRIIGDMAMQHGIQFMPAAKSDVKLDGKNYSTLQLLRNWLKDDKVLFDPDAGPVIDHMIHGKWNERRTDWQRHEKYGHFDCLSALRYLPRHVQANYNPQPPRPPESVKGTTHEYLHALRQQTEDQAFVRGWKGSR